ncbi:hypothetical protein G443_000560 [Actinoalloteichus cyanogriseus DSM 43889]|uniref:Uncharacterized protein n=1 Tax=Actinoalloteichus caeruleus DSM 43889 TaxID=1120930 RepID=A0ABT1JCR8_ACTCY|nr:hypothetical protein [Actinoalloteichus caeruleus DSM 43889]
MVIRWRTSCELASGRDPPARGPARRPRDAATAFGTRGSDVPRPDSLEGLLSTLPDARTVVDPARLASALDREPAPRVPADHTYFPLDPATTDQTDAIIFVRDI